MAATEVVKLENFDAPLAGNRMLFFYEPHAPSMPGLFDIALHGEAYARRILLTAPTSRMSSLFSAEWDAIFQPADQKEWSLILTYCLYAPKPTCIVVDDGVAPPDAFYQRLTRGTTVLVVRSLDTHATVLAQNHQYDAVFYPSISDTTSTDAAHIIRSINALTGSKDADGKRAWLRELRIARAALVWTRINEPAPAGATYWYDPLDRPSGLKRTAPSLIAHHLKNLAAQLGSA